MNDLNASPFSPTPRPPFLSACGLCVAASMAAVFFMAPAIPAQAQAPRPAWQAAYEQEQAARQLGQPARPSAPAPRPSTPAPRSQSSQEDLRQAYLRSRGEAAPAPAAAPKAPPWVAERVETPPPARPATPGAAAPKAPVLVASPVNEPAPPAPFSAQPGGSAAPYEGAVYGNAAEGTRDADRPAPVKTTVITLPADGSAQHGAAASNGEGAAYVAEPTGEREDAVRLQIFLDQRRFGPGKIDGSAKEFTLKALARYQQAHGLPVTGQPEDAAALPLHEADPIYTQHTVTAAEARQIGNVPRKVAEQAKLRRMPYTSLLIYLAERYHSDPAFLARLNPGKNMEDLRVGDTVFVPNVEPFRIEEIKEVGKLPVVPEFQKRVITINTREKMLELTEAGRLLAAFPITPGSPALPAPRGSWRILGIATLPWFRHDEGVLNHGVRTSNFHNIPSGPTNPVGVLWCGLNKPGIGVHGTNQPFTIGRAASHGCIRLANWDAIRLAGMISEGMTVIIDDGTFGAKPQQAQPKPAPKAETVQKITLR